MKSRQVMHHLYFVFDTVTQLSSIGLSHEEALVMYFFVRNISTRVTSQYL